MALPFLECRAAPSPPTPPSAIWVATVFHFSTVLPCVLHASSNTSESDVWSHRAASQPLSLPIDPQALPQKRCRQWKIGGLGVHLFNHRRQIFARHNSI